MARWCPRIHGGKGKTHRRIGRRGMRGGFPAQMAALLRLLLWRGGTPATAAGARARRWCSCIGMRGGKCAGRKKGLPRSPIYRGGVITGAVTTPPGSPASLELCGLRVAAQARVYAKHKEGGKIFCAARARDLRGRKDPDISGHYPADPGNAPVFDMTTRRPGFPGFGEILCQVSPGFWGKDRRFVIRLKAIRVNLMRPHVQVRETTPASGTTVGGVPPGRVT